MRNEKDIIYDMLKVISDNKNKIRRTKLLTKSNINSNQLNKYRLILLNTGFISILLTKEDVQYLSVTSNGFDYIQKYEDLIKTLL